MIYSTKMNTPIGQLSLVKNDKTLIRILLPNEKLNKTIVHGLYPNEEIIEVDNVFNEIVKQLTEYFTGNRRLFDIKYKLDISSFYQRALNQVIKVPYGKTASYGEIAKKINNPNAAQAVGTANAKNPLPIIIPCHRILASNGELGGYAGGLDMKKQLLELEKNNL